MSENDQAAQLLLDLWEYATGKSLSETTEEECACESETLQALYVRVRRVQVSDETQSEEIGRLRAALSRIECCSEDACSPERRNLVLMRGG